MVKVLKKTRLNIANRLLNNRLKKVSRDRSAINIDDANVVGIFFIAKEESDWLENKPFIDYLIEKKIKPRILVYLENKDLSYYYSQLQKVSYFTNEDLNWFYIPKSDAVKEFIETNFELLINLEIYTSFPSRYVIALSMAQMKVGLRSDKNPFHDLMIDLPEETKREDYFEQLKHYLSIINKK